MKQNNKILRQLRRELGVATQSALEKKLELCGFKILYFGSEGSKGDQMLSILELKEQVIHGQAFTFPGGDGCDFVFVDESLSKEDVRLALTREWCHIYLKHPVTDRILGADFHSQQEAAQLAETLCREKTSRGRWILVSVAALLAVVLLVVQLVSMADKPATNQENHAEPVSNFYAETEKSREPLGDRDAVYITKSRFHRAECSYATEVKTTRETAIEQGYGRCQICLP